MCGKIKSVLHSLLLQIPVVFARSLPYQFCHCVTNCVTKVSSSQDCWTWVAKPQGLTLHFFLPSVVLRWLEKDTSTSLFATLKRFFPWLFQTTSAPCWRLTWSATSMRRTLCLCPTLMRAWSTCRTVAAATPTPIMKAMSINNSDNEEGVFPLP